MSKEVLVVKVDQVVKADDLSKIRQVLLKQREEGVIVLPCYCSAMIVPDDVEIRVESCDGEIVDLA